MRTFSRRAALILSAVMLCLVAAPVSDACLPSPIPNRSLWDAVRVSELIVVGNLVEVDVDQIRRRASYAQNFAKDFLWSQGIRVALPEISPSSKLTVAVQEILVDTAAHGGSTVRFKVEATYSEEINSVIGSRAVFFLARENGIWRPQSYPIFELSPGDVVELRNVVQTARAANPTYQEWVNWKAIALKNPRLAPSVREIY